VSETEEARNRGAKKKIVLTGGGTAGHVTPNIALLPGLKESGFDILYIGSKEGMEKGLITAQGIPYRGVSTGKFRRYLSAKNLSDPFRVLKGYSEAKAIIREYRPDVLFSKGGFVSVPVVWAAAKYKVPVIIHESDMTPGLANKLCYGKASKICCNFPETVASLPVDKAVLTGTPIRAELLSGSREAGLAFTGLSASKPVLLMMGGSSGARALNTVLRSSLDRILPDFQVIHLCGKGNLDESIRKQGYVQYEYISDELPDLMACADLVFSRAGANAICELLALRKPNILVPLPLTASRGDQILNAKSFEKQGFSKVIEEEKLTEETLVKAIHEVYDNRAVYIAAMEASTQTNGVDAVLSLIKETAGL
jgi:UDP-N-acetylglucosamine--N-acetylmuramyl-(pentapeptide) pyrophosphoryl-undecaprenol N-acetylglucosamine transferase